MTGYQAVAKVFKILAESGAYRATGYLSPKLTIKATFVNKESVLITVGRPNYAERKFIKLAKKAGEKFPIRKIQLKWPNP